MLEYNDLIQGVSHGSVVDGYQTLPTMGGPQLKKEKKERNQMKLKEKGKRKNVKIIGKEGKNKNEKRKT